MCLIIHKPAGTGVPYDLVMNAWQDNPDGAGIMYQSDTGPVVYKVMPGDWADPVAHIGKVLAEIQDREAGVHFRWKTHGPITAAMAHPYPVADGRAFLMHNGILPVGKDYNPVVSDTVYYIRKNLDKIPGPEDLEFWRLVEQDIASNRFLIMYDNGTFLRLNDSLWSQYKGLRLSNTACVPELSNYYRTGSDAAYEAMWTEPARRRGRFAAAYKPTWTDKAPDTRALIPVDGSKELPIRLTRRERRVLRDCLRLGHWGPFMRLGDKP